MGTITQIIDSSADTTTGIKPRSRKICPYFVACPVDFCEFRKPYLFYRTYVDCMWTEGKGYRSAYTGHWWPEQGKFEHIKLVDLEEPDAD